MHTIVENAIGRWIVVCPQGHIVFGSAHFHHAAYWACVYAEVPERQCRLSRCAH